MTIRWLNTITANVSPRRKFDMEELHWAGEERCKIINAIVSGNEFNTFVLHAMLYDIGSSTLWNSVPIADPAHWPPNQSPDNEYKNDHMYEGRGYVVGHQGDGDTGRYAGYGTQTCFNGAYTYPPCNWFYSIDDSGIVDKYWVESILTAGVGSSAWTDMELIADSVNIRALHVNEIRACLQKMYWVAPYIAKTEYRLRYGQSLHKATPTAAWDAANADWESNSWGGWSEYTNGYEHIKYLEGKGSITYSSSNDDYAGRIWTQEIRLTFNMDLEIHDGGTTWPPSGHPYDSWNNYIPPLRAKLCMFPSTESGLFGKCVTTGESADCYGSGTYYGRVIDEDIISYFGGDEEIPFVFSSLNEWNSTDRNKCRPDDPGDDNTETRTERVTNRYLYRQANTAIPAYILVEPNWQFGKA